MAVEMVRKPSETPNIENVDDFMPIRYAYANQNGYVIGRGRIGTGIDADAYTINGNTFTINSGRLVIQGVECDINTEHSIVIDVSATKRYYAVYLQVNLATNTSDILVNYDTLGTPIIDAGEDLTINSVGTARIVLFTFEATNGLISNVIKVVRACDYSIPFKLDGNGVLKYRDIIIPQRKVLWSNSVGSSTAEWLEELQIGDTVEVTFSLWNEHQVVKGVAYSSSGGGFALSIPVRNDFGYMTTKDKFQSAHIFFSKTTAHFIYKNSNYEYPQEPLLYKIVKVIE